jgi:hypothetical protein
LKIAYIRPNFSGEKRVGLLPQHLKYCHPEDERRFEKNYGAALGISDKSYGKDCGYTRDSLFDWADVIYCIKIPEDQDLFREKQGFVGWIHPTGSGKQFMENCVQKKKLIAFDITNRISTRFIDNKGKTLNIDRDITIKNSILAGYASVMHAVLLRGGITKDEKVAIFGSGNVAYGAIKYLAHLGIDPVLRRRSNLDQFENEFPDYDIFINAVEINENDKAIVNQDMINAMKPNAWIIDAAADAGRFSLSFPDQLIQIDITNENMNREYSISVALTGDAKTILTQLLSVIKQYPKQSNVSRHDTIADDKQKAIKEKQSTLAWQYMNAIQNAISQQTIIFSDPTWVNGWAVYFLERQFPNTFHCTRNFCGLGFSFPAALGARLAYPNSQVMAIIGDGGFLFSQAELATAVQYQLNIITIIFNDQGFGAIKRRQHNAYKRTVGVDLPSPDFVKMAEAFGAIGIRLTTPDQLYTYLTNAWNYKKPVIIEIPLDNNDPGINI